MLNRRLVGDKNHNKWVIIDVRQINKCADHNSSFGRGGSFLPGCFFSLPVCFFSFPVSFVFFVFFCDAVSFFELDLSNPEFVFSFAFLVPSAFFVLFTVFFVSPDFFVLSEDFRLFADSSDDFFLSEFFLRFLTNSSGSLTSLIFSGSGGTSSLESLPCNINRDDIYCNASYNFPWAVSSGGHWWDYSPGTLSH